MQISQAMGQLLGRMQTNEVKAMELKPGQVVEGVVLQLFNEQDALLRIGGTQVRARLETPLRQGETAMLQVQPESPNGEIVLRTVGNGGKPLTDEALAGLLRSFGLKDAPGVQQLAAQLHRSGISLERSVLQQFIGVNAARPQHVPEGEWLEAAIIAKQRGAPFTPASVAALHSAIFGKSLEAHLSTLTAGTEQALKALLSSTNDSVNGQTREAQQLLTALRQAIDQVRAAAPSLMQSIHAGGSEQSSAAPGEVGKTPTQPQQQTQVQQQTQAQVQNQSQSQMPTQPQVQSQSQTQLSAQTQAQLESRAQIQAQSQSQLPAQPHSQTTAGSPSGGPAPGSGSALGVPGAGGSGGTEAGANGVAQSFLQPNAGAGEVASGSDRQQERPAVGQRQEPTAVPSQQAAGERAGSNGRLSGETLLPGMTPASEQEAVSGTGQPSRAAAAEQQEQAARTAGSASQPDAHQSAREENWISRLFRAVGIDHENRLARVLARSDQPSALSAETGAGLPSVEEKASLPALSEGIRREAADNLKGVLLRLAALDSVPEPLREQARQAVQHITGQQLLLAPDRNATLTHVTFMLPLHGANGSEQQAAVHIQARKGSRGEIDARNCRLLFDLNMQAIGLTLVDVQVYDKNVLLQVHNDSPVLGALIEQYRDEITDGLRGHGYQVVALKCSPFPNGGAAAPQPPGVTDSPASGRQLDAYHIKPYKSMDVRV